MVRTVQELNSQKNEYRNSPIELLQVEYNHHGWVRAYPQSFSIYDFWRADLGLEGSWVPLENEDI